MFRLKCVAIIRLITKTKRKKLILLSLYSVGRNYSYLMTIITHQIDLPYK
jgi:hypothetical protein